MWLLWIIYVGYIIKSFFCTKVIFVEFHTKAVSLSLQSLSPASAHLCLRVRNFMQHELGLSLQEKPLCIVAVSGGADSLALTVICHVLGMRLHVAHLNHGLREESAAEAVFVEHFASNLALPFSMRHCDVAALAAQQKIGIEEAGRLARYEFFEKLRIQYGAQWILTGHHSGDLCEDVLMRLLRGAAWPALGGMRGRDDRRYLLRPLLLTAKEELVALLQELDQPWCEDASNNDTAYTRNRVRQKLIPAMQEENPSFPQSVHTLWRMAAIDAAFFEEQLEQCRPQAEQGGFLLPVKKVRTLPQAIRLRAYANILRECLHTTPRARTLLELDTAFMDKRSGKIFKFAGRAEVRITPSGLFFSIIP